MTDHIFVKMYVDAVHTGLIADMGDENWRTLCAIAAFMDAQGRCYPTQARIAHALGVTRQTASRRIKRLLDYRWRGRPVIIAQKKRHGGRFDNTRYTILPNSHLRMFDVSKPDTM